MPWTETALRNERQFSTIVLNRQVGSDLVLYTVTASSNRPSRDYASQSTLSVNDLPAVVTSVSIRDGACEAVIAWGPKMGGNVLRLHWTLRQDGGVTHAIGEGEWNGSPIRAFDEIHDSRENCEKRSRTGKGEIVLADGTMADPGKADAETVRVLAAFAEMVRGSPELDQGSFNACVAACTAAAAVCGIGCAALSGPAFSFCAKCCVVAQSICISNCP
jgi:hypothetical protein